MDPNDTQPDVTQANGTVPDAVKTDVTQPAVVQPDVGAEPGLRHPKTTNSNVNGLNNTLPNGNYVNDTAPIATKANGIEPSGTNSNSMNPDGKNPNDTADSPEESARRGIDATVMRYPETGIDVLIVGAGLGGLTCALECWRKGHNVQILDRSPGPIMTGDNVQIQPSAILLLRHWPEMGYQIERDQYDVVMSYYKQTGERIYGPAPPMFNDPENIVGRRGFPSVNAHSRVKLYRAFLEQAERVGLKVEWGKKAVEFWEDSHRGLGGVVLENGEIRTGDIVVAADGLRTKSSKIVGGMDKELRTSGKAIYRAGYPIEHALRDPIVQEQWGFKTNEQPIWQFWLGSVPSSHITRQRLTTV